MMMQNGNNGKQICHCILGFSVVVLCLFVVLNIFQINVREARRRILSKSRNRHFWKNKLKKLLEYMDWKFSIFKSK